MFLKAKEIMIFFIMILICTTSSVVSSQTTIITNVPDINNPKVVEAFIDGIVKPLMKKNHTPSGVVTLMKEGEIIFAKGYGYQDIEKQIPVSPATTLFRPGSISKLFTWVSVMQQVERGNLNLDVDVNQYLRTFQIKDSWPGQPVTLRDILSHTAGFEDGGLGYLIIDDASRIVPLAQSLANHIPERVNPPGKHTAYSNWATALAGLIVSNVSGLEFNDYVQQNIFDLLEMNKTTFVEPLPNHLNEHMAKVYGWKSGRYFEKNFEIISNFGPAGAASATSFDMANFARAILGGGEFITSEGQRVQLLKSKTMKYMLSTLFTHDARTRGLAYGFMEYSYKGIDIIGHEGATSQFKSHFGLSLENNIMLFYSFSGPGRTLVHDAIKGEFYDYFFPTPFKKITPQSDFAKRADKFVGHYQSWRSNFTKIEALLAAFKEVKVSAMPDNTLLINNQRFVEVEKNLFRQVDGDQRIAFQENNFGAVTGFIYEGFALYQMYKVPFYRTLPFSTLLVLLSVFIFIDVILRRVYQRSIFQSLSANKQADSRASMILAFSNLAFVFLSITSLITARSLFYEFPLLLKFSLIFPIIALIATVYHIYRAANIWRHKIGSIWSRIHYSFISVCGVMMIWFYNYWNLLGFNYFT